MPRLLALLLLVPLASGQNTWIVDIDGLGDFTEIQPAIDASLPGDVVLIRNPADVGHHFGSIEIRRGVTLFALGPERVLTDEIRVIGVPAGEFVLLSNLSANGYRGDYHAWLPLGGAAIEVESCVGTVWIQDCEAQGNLHPGGPALLARDATVVVTGASLRGGYLGESATGYPHGAPGILAERTRLSVFASHTRGGSADNVGGIGPLVAGNGGDGFRDLGDCFVWFQGTEFVGGDGGNAAGIFDAQGGDGGDGIVLAASSTGRVRDCVLTAGHLGGGSTQNGVNGESHVGPWGFLAGGDLPLESALYSVDDGGFEFTTVGRPGAQGFLALSDRPAFHSSLEAGVRHVASLLPGGRVDLGIFPPGGEVQGATTLPDVTPGGLHPYFGQVVQRLPGGVELGSPRAVLLLDESWLPQTAQRFYVDAAAPPGGDGLSWATAFDDLRRGLGACAGLGDHPAEVWVREGLYRPTGPGGDRRVTFALKSGTHLLGGFAGGEQLAEERNPLVHVTVLSGDLNGDDTPDGQMREDNSMRVVASGEFVARQDVLVDGFTLRSGHGRQWENYGTPEAAGLTARGEIDVVRCTFVDHHLRSALFVRDADLRVFHSRFLGTRSTWVGGACRVGFFTPEEEGSALFVGCEFSGNFSAGGGGGLYTSVPTVVIGCTFVGNEADGGGAIRAMNSTAGIHISSSVFWNNLATYFAGTDDFQFPSFAAVQVEHCLFEGGSMVGQGNLEGPPLLLDPLGLDGLPGTLDDRLGLASGSPGIDAANNTIWPRDLFDLDGDGDRAEATPFDLGGRPRFHDDPTVVDTGLGTVPIVDMGAHEHL